MSESVDMYLLSVALRQSGAEPVSVGALARALDITGVSAHEMARRLSDEGWLDYVPYRGVTLTDAGRSRALDLLRKRRLWEVFLAESLGLDPAAAETAACRFEHVTPDEVGERLAEMLGHPSTTPRDEPIPPPAAEAPPDGARTTLDRVPIGLRATVVSVGGDRALRRRLMDMGVVRGETVRVSKQAPLGDPLELRVKGYQLTVRRSEARGVVVDVVPEDGP